MAGDEHNVAAGFGDARGHRADAYLGDQLHMDPRTWIGVLQVVDELLDIFDRINVMERRWTDQANTWC